MSAQIDHLSTTSDGSVLYFSTAFQLNGASRTPAGEIFRYRDDTGTFEQCIPPAVFGTSLGVMSILSAGNPDVTADGSRVAWNEFYACNSRDFHQCLGISYENPVGLITDSTFTSAKPLWQGYAAYAVELGRNGEYAAIFGLRNLVMSLADAATFQFDTLVYGASQTISDTGAVVVDGSPPRLVLATASDGASLPLQFSRRADQVRVSRDGRHILYESVRSDSTARLFFYDVASRQETLIATSSAIRNNVSNRFPYSSFSFYPCFDDTGTAVLFMNSPSIDAPAQAFLWNVGDPAPGRQITSVPEGLAEAVLSGSAKVAYASTLSNRLIRIDVATDNVRELSGRVPVVNSWFSPGTPPQTAPGSLMQANGSGLVDADGTVSVKIGDRDAFIVSGTSSQVTFQVPWELAVPNPNCAPLPVSFGSMNNAVFDGGNWLRVCTTAPFFISTVHQDFRGVVTQGDPASVGETLHFYMMGLGAVSPPAQTGVAATGDPLQYAEPLRCILDDAAQTEVKPLFAGLAPGLIGTYQLDVRLPPLPSFGGTSIVSLGCGYQFYNIYTEFYYQ